jgi:hypothetical protein
MVPSPLVAPPSGTSVLVEDSTTCTTGHGQHSARPYTLKPLVILLRPRPRKLLMDKRQELLLLRL